MAPIQVEGTLLTDIWHTIYSLYVLNIPAFTNPTICLSIETSHGNGTEFISSAMSAQDFSRPRNVSLLC